MKENLFPSGFRFRTASELEKIEEICSRMGSVVRARGFAPVLPPLVEYVEVFDRIGAGKLKEQLYKFIDPEGNLVALRPDFTTLVSRIIGMSPTMKEDEEILLYYSGEVFRKDVDPLSRNFFQFGVEWVGVSCPDVDARLIEICCEVLKTAGVETFQIELGSTDVFRALVDGLDISEEHFHLIRQAVGRKDNAALMGLAKELNISDEKRRMLTSLPELFGDRSVLAEARELYSEDLFIEKIAYIEKVVDRLTSMGLEEYVSLELGFTRGYNYYTGITFDLLVPGAGKSPGGGGRYDKLCGLFGRDRPAAGFGLNLDRILAILK